MDWDGHIKLTDFGLSKEAFTRSSLSGSFCGSPEYMCPEVLSGAGHSLSMDIYTLGALLYEMLIGLPPHYSKNRQEMYRKIVNEPVNIPLWLSKEARDLLKRLLEKDPKKRIGGRTGTQEIREHAFFRGVSWSILLNKQAKPPYSLDLRKSYFDPVFSSMPVNWAEGDGVGEERERALSARVVCWGIGGLEQRLGKVECAAKLGRAKTFKTKENTGRNGEVWKELVDLPKGPLELFQNYTYSRDQQDKSEINALKASSIKVCSVAGESSADEFADLGATRGRELIRVLTRNIRSSSLVKESPEDVESKAPLKKTLCGSSKTRLSKVVAAAETARLIKGRQSKEVESIIRMNDTVNNVISERKRYPDIFLLERLYENKEDLKTSSEEVEVIKLEYEDEPAEINAKAKVESQKALSKACKDANLNEESNATSSFLNRFPRKPNNEYRSGQCGTLKHLQGDIITNDLDNFLKSPVKKTIPAPKAKKSMLGLHLKSSQIKNNSELNYTARVATPKL